MGLRRRYKPVPLNEIKGAVFRLTPAGTSEVAELVGISRQSAARRLQTLEEKGRIWSKKVGPTTVWMHPKIMRNPDRERQSHLGYLRNRQVGTWYETSTGPRRRYGIADQIEIEQAVYRLTPAGTQEVADLIGRSRKCIACWLRVLDYREKIWSKKVGPTTVWMHPKVMADPDPERDTSAEDVGSRIIGMVYRASENQPPFGSNPRQQKHWHRRAIR